MGKGKNGEREEGSKVKKGKKGGREGKRGGEEKAREGDTCHTNPSLLQTMLLVIKSSPSSSLSDAGPSTV